MKTIYVAGVCAFALLILTLLPFAGHSMQFDADYRNVVDAAQDLAPRIADEVRRDGEKRERSLAVAVLAFGDEEGKVGESLFFAAKTLQGELTSELRNHADRKFIVWDPTQLKNSLLTRICG